MNVLLVDDEPLELEQLEYLIQPRFPMWNLYKATDGSQALAISQQKEIHLVFLDINLPGKSGLEIGEELRGLHQNLDIIMVTAHQSFQYARKSIKLKVVDYITKPIIESELNEILDQYSGSLPPAVGSRVIQDVLSMIHTKFAQKVNLSDLASEVHMNPTYLSRLFHEEVGVSFSEYLISYRIQYAKKLLGGPSEISIARIAEMTGFNSQHYFCTLFRKVTGTTPKGYRERERQ